MSRFTGKVTIVTGSSNGIGRATAVLFAKEGALLTIHGRSESALQETFDEVVGAGGNSDKILKVLGDITKDDVQKKLVDETVKKFGKIDILINNAGGMCPDNTGETGFNQTSEHFDYTMNLNVKAILNLTKLALPHLAKQKGEVVNVSSIAAKPISAIAYSYYSIAKAALDQLTRQMAGAFIKEGIRVNSVNPGAVHTKFVAKQGVTEEAQEQMEKRLSETQFIPLGRVGQPWEIAELIAYLADRKRSEFIIGQCFVIDGGTTLLNPILQAFTDIKP